jgi:hypothetical protein
MVSYEVEEQLNICSGTRVNSDTAAPSNADRNSEEVSNQPRRAEHISLLAFLHF